jgi:hypothetical protein
MKKIQTTDFDLKANVIKNLKQLLKKLLIKNMGIFYVKKWNQNNQDIVNIIKKNIFWKNYSYELCTRKRYEKY